jgi:hypothetical protein
MKYIERLLSYNDRYYKSRNDGQQVYCPISLKLISDLLSFILVRHKKPGNIELLLTNDGQTTLQLQDMICKETRPGEMITVLQGLFKNNFKLMHIIDQFSQTKHVAINVSF